jgi:hypothetical protein
MTSSRKLCIDFAATSLVPNVHNSAYIKQGEMYCERLSKHQVSNVNVHRHRATTEDITRGVWTLDPLTPSPLDTNLESKKKEVVYGRLIRSEPVTRVRTPRVGEARIRALGRQRRPDRRVPLVSTADRPPLPSITPPVQS